MSVNEPDRPLENWKYPYVAGAVDFGSHLAMKVNKASDTSVGFRIAPELYFSNSDETVLGFLDEFAEDHDLEPRFYDTSSSYQLRFTKRGDVEKMFRLVRPYLLARHNEAEILIKNLIPGLEMGKASSREGFYQLMEYVDQIREETQAGSDVKYDQAYFREEWGM
jgi:hypothetical protein